MDDQSDLGAKKSEIIRPASETKPTAIIPYEINTTINSQGFIKRNWWKIAIPFAGIVLVITFFNDITAIPNNIMGLMANTKALFHKQAPVQPAFYVMCKTESGPRDQAEANNPIYWYFDDWNGQKLLWPVQILMFIQFTNLKPYDITIDSYSVEGKTTNGWAEYVSVDTRTGTLYICNDSFHKCFPSEFQRFDDVIFSNSIEPNKTITGVILLELPLDIEMFTAFRFHIKTMAGEDFTQPIAMPSALDLNAKTLVLTVGPPIDLSTYGRANYHKQPK